MSRLASFTPLAVESREQRLAREKAAPAGGILQGTADAVASEWMGARALRLWDRIDTPYDPNFRVTEPLLKTLGEGIPPDLLHKFGEAASMDDAKVIREQLLGLDQRRTRLSRLGMTGTALQIGASILDPAAIALMVTTDGIAGEAVYGAKLSRMQRVIRSGLFGGSQNAAIEAYASSDDPTKSMYDVLWAGVGGFILTGIGGEAVRGLLGKSQAALRAIEADEITYAMGAAARGELSPDIRRNIAGILSERGRAHYADSIDDAATKQLVDDIISRAGFDAAEDADLIAELRAMDPATALEAFHRAQDGRAWADIVQEVHPSPHPAEPGPAAVGPPKPPEPPPKKGGDLFLPDVQDIAKAAFNRVRFGLAGTLGKSDSSIVRRLAYFMGGDSLYREGAPAIGGVARWTQRNRDALMTRFWREFESIGHEYAAARGKRFTGRFRAEFAETVSRTVRLAPQAFSDPHVNRAADLARSLIRDVFETAQRHGVKGSVGLEASETYLPIIHDPILWQRAVSAHGEEPIHNLIAGALKSAAEQSGETLADESAQAGARAYLRGVLALDDYSDTLKGVIFSGITDPDELADFVRFYAPSTSESHVADLVRAFAKQVENPEAGVTGRLRKRTPLDLQYREVMPDGTEISVQDLLKNNIEDLVHNYARDLYGASGMAELYRAMTPPDRPTPIQSWSALKDMVERDLNESGIASDKTGKRVAEQTMLRLETLRRGIMGQPQQADTAFGQMLRTARGINYLKDSGGFGVAQLADLGNTVAEGGVRAVLQQLPAIKAIFRRAKNGELSNELLNDIEAVLASGTQRIRSQIVDRIDYTGEVPTVATSGLDRSIQRLNRFASDASGLHAADALTQRATAAIMAQRVVNMAFTGKPMSEARLLSIGLTRQDADRLFAAIRHEAGKTANPGVYLAPGPLGRDLRHFDLGKWDDVYAASKFADAVDQWSRRAVQQVDLGNIPKWMTTELGRTFMQFRTFSTVSWEKHFLSRLQTLDGPAIAGMAYSSMIGGLAYVAQQYVASLGRADAGEFREKRLSTQSIVRAAVQRGSWSTFGPDAFDTVYRPIFGEPFFSFRNTGLDTGFLSPSSNPTVQAFQDAYGSIGNVSARLLRGEPLTAKKLDQIARLLPFHNVVGVKNLIDSITTNAGEEP